MTDAAGVTLLTPDFPKLEGESTLTEDAAWTSSGETVIVRRIRSFRSWAEAKQVFPKDGVTEIEKLSEEIPAIIRATTAMGGDADSIDLLLDRLKTSKPDLLRNAFHLSYEKDPETIRQALSSSPKLLAKLEEDESKTRAFLLYQIDLVEFDSGKASTRPILKSVALLTRPVISPDDRHILMGARIGEKTLVDLISFDITDSTEQTLARRIYPAYVWKDNQSVYALSPVLYSDGILKQLKRFTLDAENEKVREETLATALMPFSPRIEVLPDKSLLLASQSSILPSAEIGTPPGSALFRFLPEQQELVRVPTPEKALPMNLGFFKVSPDGELIAIVESDTDAVAVVEIASGKVDLISEPRPNGKCRTLPAWRNAEELSFARLNQERNKIEWVLWNRNGQTRVLNEKWPEDLTANWIEIKKPIGK